MKAQISVEALIVLAVLLGVALLLASVMFRSAGSAAERIEKKANETFSVVEGGGKAKAGGYCRSDADCESFSCDTYSNRCN
ncbi:MAG: hypothetical protein N3G22_00450 [Candidatus Micrarchaeota archaeon]|nr:hypothetical protein [Candidatus Micrarchaeota archaeon]